MYIYSGHRNVGITIAGPSRSPAMVPSTQRIRVSNSSHNSHVSCTVSETLPLVNESRAIVAVYIKQSFSLVTGSYRPRTCKYENEPMTKKITSSLYPTYDDGLIDVTIISLTSGCNV